MQWEYVCTLNYAFGHMTFLSSQGVEMTPRWGVQMNLQVNRNSMVHENEMCQNFVDDRFRGRHSGKGRFVGVYKKFQKLVQFDNVYLLRSGDKKGFRVN